MECPWPESIWTMTMVEAKIKATKMLQDARQDEMHPMDWRLDQVSIDSAEERD